MLWNMQDKHASWQLKLQARAMALRELSNNCYAEPVLKKSKIGDDEVWQMEAKFVR